MTFIIQPNPDGSFYLWDSLFWFSHTVYVRYSYQSAYDEAWYLYAISQNTAADFKIDWEKISIPWNSKRYKK